VHGLAAPAPPGGDDRRGERAAPAATAAAPAAAGLAVVHRTTLTPGGDMVQFVVRTAAAQTQTDEPRVPAAPLSVGQLAAGERPALEAAKSPPQQLTSAAAAVPPLPPSAWRPWQWQQPQHQQEAKEEEEEEEEEVGGLPATTGRVHMWWPPAAQPAQAGPGQQPPPAPAELPPLEAPRQPLTSWPSPPHTSRRASLCSLEAAPPLTLGGLLCDEEELDGEAHGGLRRAAQAEEARAVGPAATHLGYDAPPLLLGLPPKLLQTATHRPIVTWVRSTP